jgi:hypothetical protein
MSQYEENAHDYYLWVKNVDPHEAISRAEFFALSVEEKIQIQIDAFGEEQQ